MALNCAKKVCRMAGGTAGEQDSAIVDIPKPFTYVESATWRLDILAETSNTGNTSSEQGFSKCLQYVRFVLCLGLGCFSHEIRAFQRKWDQKVSFLRLNTFGVVCCLQKSDCITNIAYHLCS